MFSREWVMEQVVLSKDLSAQAKVEALTILVNGRSSPEQVWNCIQSLAKAENNLAALPKNDKDNALMDSILSGGGF